MHFNEENFYSKKVVSAGLILTDGDKILGCEKWVLLKFNFLFI